MEILLTIFYFHSIAGNFLESNEDLEEKEDALRFSDIDHYVVESRYNTFKGK